MRPLNVKAAGILFFLSLLFISQILIPQLSPQKDFLIFTRWNLFSSKKPQPAFDIQLGEQNGILLFRDKRLEAKAFLNIHTLFFLVSSANADAIRNGFKARILEFCNCDQIKLVKLNGNLYEHLILKKKLEITESLQL